jgi:hypothetical protein
MFQLQLADPDVTNGTVAVSWCLDQEVLKELADLKISDPQVVICVAPVDNYHLNKEYRKVIPLKDLMTYIEFRAGGKNKIWGFISHKNGRKARNHYLEKNDGEFHTNVLNYDGDKYASVLLDNEDDEGELEQFKWLSTPITVTVPKAVFAKEPPKWEKTWVNHLFRDKVVDQCEFRRRRLFAYGVQPWIVLSNIFLRLFLTVFAAGSFAKGFTFQYLLHPLMYSLRDTMDLFDKGSLLIRHLPEDDKDIEKFPKPGYFVRSFYLVPLMPVIWAPLLILLLSKHYAPAFIVSVSLAIVAAIIMITSFLANHARMLKEPFTKAWGWMNAPSEDLWYLNQDEVEIITCNQNKKPLTYNSLPANRKTARLRFQVLKSKVCKPFSL